MPARDPWLEHAITSLGGPPSASPEAAGPATLLVGSQGEPRAVAELLVRGMGTIHASRVLAELAAVLADHAEGRR